MSKRKRKPLKKQPRVRRRFRLLGIDFMEEPTLSPKLFLEKDTFSGGYNNTIRARNERRHEEWAAKNSYLWRIEGHIDALGFRRPVMILVPTHLWDKVCETAMNLGKSKSRRVAVEEIQLAEGMLGETSDVTPSQRFTGWEVPVQRTLFRLG